MTTENTVQMISPTDADEGVVEEYEYKSDVKPTWCPGCGDFGVLNATYLALKEKQLNPKDVVCVSGIGCSSRFPFFVNTYGFHAIHGRVMPVATGIKAANPNLTVLAFGGDGDGFAIGGGHFIHAVRRNLDITYVIMDNSIYGLTKGQTSPTSNVNFVTKTTPQGSQDQALNPLTLALTLGATFVARGFSGKPKDVTDLILQGMEHKGFSFIDVYSPCPTFNKVNTFKFYKEEVAAMPADHDTSDRFAAMRLADSSDPLYTGVFYKGPHHASFEEHQKFLQAATPADPIALVNKLLSKYS